MGAAWGSGATRMGCCAKSDGRVGRVTDLPGQGKGPEIEDEDEDEKIMSFEI